ncbi:hypothetical protein [Bufonid herpesvirus 1]|uniref:hypothetical protein n=1 Tax=Bufonid herpesvirus 1 TaxID=2282206 RepID=UPI000EB6BF4B|nr:hypothetical protein [Bufonid herpesvirus 1]AXF48610.1 hypothetical protein [Bufonid herpesvirus 1]
MAAGQKSVSQIMQRVEKTLTIEDAVLMGVHEDVFPPLAVFAAIESKIIPYSSPVVCKYMHIVEIKEQLMILQAISIRLAQILSLEGTITPFSNKQDLFVLSLALGAEAELNRGLVQSNTARFTAKIINRWRNSLNMTEAVIAKGACYILHAALNRIPVKARDLAIVAGYFEFNNIPPRTLIMCLDSAQYAPPLSSLRSYCVWSPYVMLYMDVKPDMMREVKLMMGNRETYAEADVSDFITDDEEESEPEDIQDTPSTSSTASTPSTPGTVGKVTESTEPKKRSVVRRLSFSRAEIKHKTREEQKTPGSQPCLTRDCKSCEYVEKTDYVKRSAKPQEMFYIKHGLDCTSNNVIYIVTCELCQIQYVGRTSKNVGIRIRQHIYSIYNPDKNNKARALKDHLVTAHGMNFRDKRTKPPIKFTLVDTGSDIDNLEDIWINRMDTLEHGLNRIKASKQSSPRLDTPL